MRHFYLIFLFCIGLNGIAQSLRGTVTEYVTGETIPTANVIVKIGQTIVDGGMTDFDGKYLISPLSPGTYNVEVSFVGYATKKIEGVVISPSKSTQLDVTLSEGGQLLQEVVMEYKQPVIDSDRKSYTITKQDVSAKPIRGVSGVAAQTGGVSQRDQGTSLSVRGGRSSNKIVYFVDGVKVLGSPNISNSAMDQVQVITGGTPAEFGGNISMNKVPSTKIDGIPRKRIEKPEEITVNESYEEIIENEFLNSFQNPVTTFSIDVDRASYSNFRRFVNTGVTPPKHSVRIEEFVNYFNYDYRKPKDDLINVYTELSTCPWNANNQLLHIGLQSKDFKKEGQQASNLVFLIDVSGSMSSYNKLPLVQKTLSMLTKQLGKNDKISIVVYSGAAGCVLEPTSGNETDEILNALNTLESGGSTAGGEGIELAYSLAMENFKKNGNNRVILATDGDFNVGVSSNEGLEELIANKRESNVFLTVLGYGMGNYKDDKLEILANKGNGNYAYIDNLQEAEEFLIKDFNSTLFTLAKDVKLQLEFNPKYVKEYRLIGYENRALENRDFIDDTIDAGELGVNQSVTALYEIIPNQTAEQEPLKYQKAVYSEELLTLKIRYKEPKKKESKELKFPVKHDLLTIEETSNRFRFSAAVAMFGHILRDSKYKEQVRCSNVLNLARKSKFNDENGYKGEFIRLVRTYRNSLPLISDNKNVKSR